MWVNEKPNSNHGRSSFISDAVIMWINEKPNWIHYDFLSLWKLVIGGFQEPWQIQQPRRWRFWPWRFNVPATIPSLSLETRVGGVRLAAGWFGGVYLLFQKSHHKLSNTKKWGGGTLFQGRSWTSPIYQKKRENWKMIWKLGVGYISHPGGVRMFGDILFVRPPLGKVPWKSGFQLPSVSHGNISRSTRKGVHKTAARISFRSSSLPWICRYCWWKDIRHQLRLVVYAIIWQVSAPFTRWFSCRISEPSTVADVIFPWGFLSSLVVFWEDLASAESNVDWWKLVMKTWQSQF